MTSITVPNIGDFNVDVFDTGSGKPLVYLHGYERHPGSASFLRRLATSRRVIAPELPGYGTSEGVEHFTDVHDVALYLRAFLGSLDVDRVDVIGHSLGGMFAAELATIAPDRIGKLVLVDPFGVWYDDKPAVNPFGDVKKALSAKWHGDAPKDEPSNFIADPNEPHAKILQSARSLGTATKFMWPMPDRGLRRRLPYIGAKTLVVRGSSDGFVPSEYAEEFVRLIPNAALTHIDEAGHYPMIEQEDAFVSVVNDFLEER